jgi:hypothetical protein
VGLILLPLSLLGGCLGIVAALRIRRTVPSFQVALVASLAGWILGGAFDLAATFGGWYEAASRIVPHAHAVELLFPSYYGTGTGSPGPSLLALALLSLAGLAATSFAYQGQVLRRE